MTTITTPVRIGDRHPRTILLAVLGAVVATGIGLAAWTLVDSRGGDPATVDPAIARPDVPELPVAEVIGAEGQLLSELPRGLSAGLSGAVESGSVVAEGQLLSELPRGLSAGLSGATS